MKVQFPERLPALGVLSHVGTGNLGEEATVVSVIENLRVHLPNTRLYGFFVRPEGVRQRLEIPVFPLRPAMTDKTKPRISAQETDRRSTVRNRLKTSLVGFPRLYGWLKWINALAGCMDTVFREIASFPSSFLSVRHVDLLLIAGGGPLFDYFGGPWTHPYTVLKWVLLATVSRVRVAFLSVGAGPIDSALSRRFIRLALWLAEYRSYRDSESRRFVEEQVGFTGQHYVYPDLAWGLRSVASPSISSSRSADVVGVNPMPFKANDWPEQNLATYRRYIIRLSSFVRWLLEQGKTVVFIPTQIYADATVIRDILALLPNYKNSSWASRLLTPEVGDLNDLLRQLKQVDVLIATRFHGVLLSAVLRKPVIAISYHPKVDSLMRDMEQEKYLLDIDTFETSDLVERYKFLDSDSELIRGQLHKVSQKRKRNLENQYESLFGQSRS